MIALLQLFFAGIAVGSCLTVTVILMALQRVDRIVVGRNPTPIDPREVTLERLRSVESVLAVALRQVPAVGYRVVPRGMQ